MSQFAVMFFADREAAIAEMSRVLRPGGRIAIATWASLEENPGYAAFVDLIRRLAGEGAADAMSAPFVLGDHADVRRLLEGTFDDVAVETLDGIAHFDSLDDWVVPMCAGRCSPA